MGKTMIPQGTSIGNCWIKAYLLARKTGGTVRYFRTRSARCGNKHYYCQTPDKLGWHFRIVKDFLPWPLCGLLFIGRYECLSNRDKPNAPKQEQHNDISQNSIRWDAATDNHTQAR